MSVTTNKQLNGQAGALQVNDGGTGSIPVMFVHSFGGDQTHWNAQLEHLRKNRRAVAFDLRGHGRSAAAADNNDSIDALASDIAAVADQLRLPRFVLVGHSIGGAAALVYAGKYPQRLAGLVLVGAPGRTPPEQSKPIVAALESDAYEKVMGEYWEKLLTNAVPEVRAQLESGRRQMPRERSLGLIKATFAYDPAPSLRAYSGPTLLVGTPAEDQPGALHRLAPNLAHLIVSGTSHWIQMDKPDEFNRILDEFLSVVH